MAAGADAGPSARLVSDLIVSATRGRTGFAHALLDSTTERLVRQLRKIHNQELSVGRERAHPRIAAVTANGLVEFVFRQLLHQLSKDGWVFVSTPAASNQRKVFPVRQLGFLGCILREPHVRVHQPVIGTARRPAGISGGWSLSSAMAPRRAGRGIIREVQFREPRHCSSWTALGFLSPGHKAVHKCVLVRALRLLV